MAVPADGTPPYTGIAQMCKGFVVALAAPLVSYAWVLPAASDF